MSKKNKILVTGGCGYKGTVLIPKLLDRGYSVICLDNCWFGNYLSEHPNLEIIKADILDQDVIPFSSIETIIHLASIANDPCGDLNPKLTWEVSVLATMKLLENAKRKGVGRIIYASSGSVYGVKQEHQVTEDLSLLPISEYNKTKMCAERVILSYQDSLAVQIVRPATVCGYSRRMRLDVAVNLLTMQALTNKKITVLGGKQVRPNIHIDDITDLYIFLLENPTHQGIYNAGFENLSIIEIAEMVTKEIPAEIEVKPSNDPRSYRLNSDKLLATGFSPKFSVSDAICEIKQKYETGILADEDKFYNLRWMQKKLGDQIG